MRGALSSGEEEAKAVVAAMAGSDAHDTPSGQHKQDADRKAISGSAARAARDRGPMASREGSAQKAAQDVEGLKDYQLGDCLGKGAFGSVYRALNWGTGETVAIKQVRLADLPQSELKVIMLEIDLLKNLNHANIVKYNGFVKSTDSLYIILEYCENGSLHSICKNFGKFPENLVALYMSQVLHGLVYLHEQGVIHRDIKGANILTTKEGTVKLADFGVATKAAGLDEANVVGTPYWMAPEVIELTGATTASDIWSLGCTVIELIEGRPPYNKLQPMQALFRIVNDEHPPLPASVSPVVRDFLMQCFQKNPNLRISAKRLLKHPWILSAKRTDAIVPSKPTKYDEAVKSVQEWNEALKSPNPDSVAVRRTTRSTTLGVMHRDREPTQAKTLSAADTPVNFSRPQPHLNIPKLRPGSEALLPRLPESFRSPDIDSNNWDADFVSSPEKGLLQLRPLKPQDNFAGQLSSERLKSFATFESSSIDESLMDGFPDSDLTVRGPLTPSFPINSDRPSSSHGDATVVVKKPPSRRKSSLKEHQTAFYRPQSLPVAKTRKVSTRSPSAYRDDAIEDYSEDLLPDGDDMDFQGKVDALQARNPLAPKLSIDESDLTPPTKKMQHSGTMPSRAPSASKSIERPLLRSQSDISDKRIEKFVDDDVDADFSDIFASRTDSDSGSELAINSKMSASFAEEDEHDPFAILEESVPTKLADDVVNAKLARLQKQTEDWVGYLKTNQHDNVIQEVAEEILNSYAIASNDAERDTIVRAILRSHGILPILDILKEDPQPPRTITVPLMKIINLVLEDNAEAIDSAADLGAIPAVTLYGRKRFSTEERQEAAAFVRQMCRSPSSMTLRFFVACQGIDILVEFLEEDVAVDREIVLIGVFGVYSIFFNVRGPIPKNDYCRMLSQKRVLQHLSLILSRVLHDDDNVSKLVVQRVVNIFLIFSQAETYVKEMIADRTVLNRIFRDLRRLAGDNLITMLKFIKNLSMLASTHEVLISSNAIETMTELLQASKGKRLFREISNQVLNTMYNILRLNRSGQEEAALNGIIPLLKEVVGSRMPLKEFALPILCEMAHAGKISRSKLWEQNGLKFYISLLSEAHWQNTALDAIHVWLQEETARVEQYLLGGAFTSAIIKCFDTPEIVSDAFQNSLDPLQKILFLSPPLAATFANREFFQKAAEKFSSKRAVLKVSLLRIIQYICETSEEQGALLQKFDIEDKLRELAHTDGSILVQQLAADLLGMAYRRPSSSSSSSTPYRPRVPSMGRKSLVSNYNPPTPTASYRSRPSSRRQVVLNQALPSPTSTFASTPPVLTHSQTMPVVPESRLPRRESTSHNPSPISPTAIASYATPSTETRKTSMGSQATSSFRPTSRDNNSGGSVTSIISSLSSTSLSSTASAGSSSRAQPNSRESSRVVQPSKRLPRYSLASSGSNKGKSEENTTPPDRSTRPLSQGGPGGLSAPPTHKLVVRRRRETSTGIASDGNGSTSSRRGQS